MKSSTPRTELPIILFDDAKAWEKWLEENHDSSPGIWMQLGKKGSEIRSVSYPEAVEVALCYGWIDGQKNKYDESSSLQKFTPRGARSIWSKINRGRAEELISNGRMRPAGLRAVESARKDGRWDAAYDSPSTASVPDDLQEALDNNPKAKAFFATLKGSNRYAILFRIQTAKKAETRIRRIQQFVEMLERNEKIY